MITVEVSSNSQTQQEACLLDLNDILREALELMDVRNGARRLRSKDIKCPTWTSVCHYALTGVSSIGCYLGQFDRIV